MTYQKVVSLAFSCAMLALTACSSTSGTASPPPTDTTVVVPPTSSVTVSH